MGLSLFVAGIICTCVPPTVGLFFGYYILRMNPVLLLGAIPGAQTMTAAMVAVQDQAKSRTPVLGFTVPYALGNIILTTWGTVIVCIAYGTLNSILSVMMRLEQELFGCAATANSEMCEISQCRLDHRRVS